MINLEEFKFNPFIHNVEKWSKILLKSYGVHTAGFLKYAIFQHYEWKGFCGLFIKVPKTEC